MSSARGANIAMTTDVVMAAYVSMATNVSMAIDVSMALMFLNKFYGNKCRYGNYSVAINAQRHILRVVKRIFKARVSLETCLVGKLRTLNDIC